jgi:hypothetical protein
MGRPKMNEAKKKTSISVSLSPGVMAEVSRVDNKSHFLDQCVGVASGLSGVIKALRDKTMSFEDAMEELEDFASIYDAQFEESYPIAVLENRDIRKTGS